MSTDARETENVVSIGAGRGLLGPVLLMVTIGGTFGLALSLDPIGQPLSYHAFADSRLLCGVPNFWNVISNLPFLVFGLLGLVYVLRVRPQGARLSWAVFFAALALVAFGSGWYHLSPDNPRLVWDRMPIAIAMVALFVGMLSEHVNPVQERWLWPVVILSAGTVILWHYTDDLRLYLWVQAFTMIGVLVFMLAFKPAYTQRGWLLAALLLFLLAKLFEHYDIAVYYASGKLLSGHTIKHFLSGFAPLAVLMMLMRRRPINA